VSHGKTQQVGDYGFAQAYHALYAWLSQVVYQLLYRRQVERRDSYREGLQYFEGIARLAQKHRPLWIFSLNHDVLVECIAALFGIEVNAGFSPRTVLLPCRGRDGQAIAALAAETLTDAELASGQLPFFKTGWPGINLLKLHGALDVFSYGDGHDLVRLKPEDQTFDAIIDALQIANEGLLDANLVSSLVPDPLAVTNKIPYIDGDGQPQVLGRTLLAGAARLTDPYPPLMQRRLLEYFRASLAQTDRLVAIGAFLSMKMSGARRHGISPIWQRALGSASPAIALSVDALSVVMILVVSVVGFLIHLFSIEHMAGEEEYPRFFAYMNLFVAFMLILVLADNFLLLYLGWEGVGLCSFLLIGFWHRDRANGDAARFAG